MIGESTGTRSARSPLRKNPAIEMTGIPLLRAKAMVESAASPTSNCPAPTSCTVVTEPVPCWIVTSSPAFLNQPFSAARKNGAWYPVVSQSSRTERVCASSAASAACPANARANTDTKTVFNKFISVLPKLGFSHERGAAYKTLLHVHRYYIKKGVMGRPLRCMLDIADPAIHSFGGRLTRQFLLGHPPTAASKCLTTTLAGKAGSCRNPMVLNACRSPARTSSKSKPSIRFIRRVGEESPRSRTSRCRLGQRNSVSLLVPAAAARAPLLALRLLAWRRPSGGQLYLAPRQRDH